jgi:hypothetical protein
MPLVACILDHPQSKEVEVISAIINAKPTIYSHILQDLNRESLGTLSPPGVCCAIGWRFEVPEPDPVEWAHSHAFDEVLCFIRSILISTSPPILLILASG